MAAIVIVVLVELIPKFVSEYIADVTLSIRAQTEVVELVLDTEREYFWWVPPGKYLLLQPQDAPEDECAAAERESPAHPQYFQCTFKEPTSIVLKTAGDGRDSQENQIHGDVTVHLEAPSGLARFGIRIAPASLRREAPPVFMGWIVRPVAAVWRRIVGWFSSSEPAPATELVPRNIEILDKEGEVVARTSNLLTFESESTEPWRIPLILKEVQIGEFLRESTSDSRGEFRQPIMLDGDVRVFSRFFISKNRYQVQQEDFDPADVVTILANSDPEALLLGLLSLSAASETFDLTLHTDLEELLVRRLGAAHEVGVSMWSIISKLPFWLALWAVLASLVVVANYQAARLTLIEGRENAARKE